MTTELKAWPQDSRSLDTMLLGDGLVFRGYVAAVPRKHAAFQYTFRPLTPEEIAATEQAVHTASQRSRAAGIQIAAKVIAEHVVWAAATGGPLSIDQVKRLHDSIFNKVYLQIIGSEPMDEGIDAEPQTATDALADQLGN